MRKVLDRTRTQFGNQHQRVANAEGKLGEALGDQGGFEEAETLLLSSHAFQLRTSPSGDDRIAVALQRLVNLYEAWGRPEEAQKWRAGRP